MAMHNNDSEFHFSLNKKEHPSTVLILLVLELRVERFLSQSYRPIRKIPLDKFRIPGLLTNSDQTLPTSLLLAEASSLPLLLIPPFCETWKFAKTFLCTRPSWMSVREGERKSHIKMHFAASFQWTLSSGDIKFGWSSSSHILFLSTTLSTRHFCFAARANRLGDLFPFQLRKHWNYLLSFLYVPPSLRLLWLKMAPLSPPLDYIYWGTK